MNGNYTGTIFMGCKIHGSNKQLICHQKKKKKSPLDNGFFTHSRKKHSRNSTFHEVFYVSLREPIFFFIVLMFNF